MEYVIVVFCITPALVGVGLYYAWRNRNLLKAKRVRKIGVVISAILTGLIIIFVVAGVVYFINPPSGSMIEGN